MRDAVNPSYSVDFPVQDKLQFLWCSSRLRSLRRLTPALLREACELLGFPFASIPSIRLNALRVFDLRTNRATVSQLPVSFTSGIMYCFIERDLILCLGGYPKTANAWFIRPATSEVLEIEPMKVARSWPGIYPYAGKTYVFGGNYPQIRSCEKLSMPRKWSALPDMQCERYCFSPAYFQGELYLFDALSKRRIIEAFRFDIETFRAITVEIPVSLTCNSISFVTGGELHIVTEGHSHAQWRINAESRMRKAEGVWEAPAFAQCPVLVRGGNAYFCNHKVENVVCFVLGEGRVSQVSEFEFDLGE